MSRVSVIIRCERISYPYQLKYRRETVDEQTRQAARLWTLAQPVVSAFVTSVVRDFSARDDVLQEVAVAVIESFERYDSTRPFVGWALGIAQNQVGLYLRRVRRDRLVLDEDAISCLASAFESTASGTSQKLDYLQECLRGLEARARELCDCCCSCRRSAPRPSDRTSSSCFPTIRVGAGCRWRCRTVSDDESRIRPEQTGRSQEGQRGQSEKAEKKPKK